MPAPVLRLPAHSSVTWIPGLPDCGDRVLANQWVNGQNRKLLHLALRHQHAVERFGEPQPAQRRFDQPLSGRLELVKLVKA